MCGLSSVNTWPFLNLKISHIGCRYQISDSVLIFKLVLMFNHDSQLERTLPKHDI